MNTFNKMTCLILILLSVSILPRSLPSYNRIEHPFKIGEFMEFEIKLGNISVAILKVWIKGIEKVNDVDCYHIYADIQTVNWVSKIYHLHDKINAYIDKNTLYSLRIRTLIKEGSWTNQIAIDIDREKKELHYVDKRKDKIVKYEGEVLGLVSLIYYARTMVPEKDEKIKFVVSNGDNINYVDTVVKSTDDTQYAPKLKKKFKTFLYEQIGGKNVALWISKDPYRIPVRMISVRLKLAGYGIANIEAWITKFKP
ncbi:MAG: DUF3108 domain-containing protein [Spirochaetes bacterium]|nr:DUF3108 domain-containing protein [Spirochaetota bacterium]